MANFRFYRQLANGTAIYEQGHKNDEGLPGCGKDTALKGFFC